PDRPRSRDRAACRRGHDRRARRRGRVRRRDRDGAGASAAAGSHAAALVHRRRRAPGGARMLRMTGGPVRLLLTVATAGIAAALVWGVPLVGVRPLAAMAAALVIACASWNVWGLAVPATAPWGLYMGALAAFHLGLIVPWVAGVVDAPTWLPTVPSAL